MVYCAQHLYKYFRLTYSHFHENASAKVVGLGFFFFLTFSTKQCWGGLFIYLFWIMAQKWILLLMLKNALFSQVLLFEKRKNLFLKKLSLKICVQIWQKQPLTNGVLCFCQMAYNFEARLKKWPARPSFHATNQLVPRACKKGVHKGTVHQNNHCDWLWHCIIFAPSWWGESNGLLCIH